MEFIMHLNREHRFVGEIQGELFESANVHLYQGETEDSIRAKLLKFVSKIATDGEIKPSTFELFSIWNKSWETELVSNMEKLAQPSTVDGQSYPVDVSPIIDHLIKHNCD